jgi:hypothetical protein
LNDGTLSYFGNVTDAIHFYTDNIFSGNSFQNFLTYKSEEKSYIQVHSLSINNQQKGTVLLSDGNNTLHVQLEGDILFDKKVAFECILYDKDLKPLLFYSPSHYNGQTKQLPSGSFIMEEFIQLPPNINRGHYTASIFLTDPDIQYHVKFEYVVNIQIDGFPMKTGQIFDYDGKGFLFQPMQRSEE